MAQCNLAGPGSAVRPIVGHGLINIYNRKEARREGDLFPAQAIRISTTIPTLVMIGRNIQCRSQIFGPFGTYIILGRTFLRYTFR